MKKVVLLVLVAFMTLAVCPKAQAIEDPNPTGTLVVGARAGIFYGYGANVVADYTLIDHWWKGHFTVGAYTGFNWNPYYTELENVRLEFWNWALMPRATYGLNITDDFEVHAGVMTGFCVQHWPPKYHFEDPNHILFSHGEFVGVRYLFTDNFGVEAEVVYSSNIGRHDYDRYGMSYFNVGFTFKF